MKSAKKPSAQTRPVVISSLAARLLGHLRVAGTAVSAQRLTVRFPAFSSRELANALNELLEKHFFTRQGKEDHATYSVTDFGRDSRVAVG